MHPEITGDEAHKDPILGATITKSKLSQQQQLHALRISACGMCFTEHIVGIMMGEHTAASLSTASANEASSAMLTLI